MKREMADLKPFLESSLDHLRLFVDSGHIGIWELDLPSGNAWRNRHHDQIFGYDTYQEEWTYQRFLDHVVEDDRQRVNALQMDAINEKREWVFQCRIVRTDGSTRWISASGRPLLDEAGTVRKLIGHVIDITDIKENEGRLALVADELHHRVRNMFAMISSIIGLSSRSAADIETFSKALLGRVGALARTHEMLVGEAEGSFSATQILEAELAAFPELEGRTDIRSDHVTAFGKRTTQGLALVLHELITNAIKYGAFSTEAGRVKVEISQFDGAVVLRWSETGGPPVAALPQGGFGSRLMSSALGRLGQVSVSYLPEGVVCTIRIPEASTAS